MEIVGILGLLLAIGCGGLLYRHQRLCLMRESLKQPLEEVPELSWQRDFAAWQPEKRPVVADPEEKRVKNRDKKGRTRKKQAALPADEDSHLRAIRELQKVFTKVLGRDSFQQPSTLPLTREILRSLQQLVDMMSSPLLVTVLGSFSSGKSTFINALLGEELLAMKIKATTAVITRLQYGPKRRMLVHYQDGRVQEVALEDAAAVHSFTAMLSKKDDAETLKSIFYVQIELNNPLLKHFDIADTPGFNSGYQWHTDVTNEFIGFSDVILWMFTASQTGTKTEFNILSEHTREMQHRIGIVNKIDTLQLASGAAAEREYKALRRSIPVPMEKVFFVDSRRALQAESQAEYVQSHVPEVRNYLLQDVAKKNQQYKAEHIRRKLQLLIIQAADLFREGKKQQNGLQTEIQALEQEIARYKQAIWQGAVKEQSWQEDRKKLPVVDILSKLKSYFLSQEQLTVQDADAQRFLRRHADLSQEARRLEQQRLQLDRDKTDLAAKEAALKTMQQKYQGGFTALADGVWKFFSGNTFSEAKEALDRCESEYRRMNAQWQQAFRHCCDEEQSWNQSWQQLQDEEQQFLKTQVEPLIWEQHKQMDAYRKAMAGKNGILQQKKAAAKVLKADLEPLEQQAYPLMQQEMLWAELRHKQGRIRVYFAGRREWKQLEELSWQEFYGAGELPDALAAWRECIRVLGGRAEQLCGELHRGIEEVAAERDALLQLREECLELREQLADTVTSGKLRAWYRKEKDFHQRRAAAIEKHQQLWQCCTAEFLPELHHQLEKQQQLYQLDSERFQRARQQADVVEQDLCRQRWDNAVRGLQVVDSCLDQEGIPFDYEGLLSGLLPAGAFLKKYLSDENGNFAGYTRAQLELKGREN